MPVLIRPIALTDAEVAARLSGELGYPASTAAMEARIRNLASLPAHAVFVACIDDTVVGWIDVGVVYHLQTEAKSAVSSSPADFAAPGWGAAS